MFSELLVPSGAGDYAQLSPDPAGANWVNAASLDRKILIVFGPNTKHDAYQMSDSIIPDGAVIDNVLVTVEGLFTNSIGGWVRLGFIIGGIIYQCGPIKITETEHSYEFSTNPATGLRWTKSAINGAQLFIELYAGSSGTYTYVDYVYATLHYTLPAGGQVRIIGMGL